MRDYPVSASQVQAASGETFAAAQAAVYLAAAASEWTLAQFSERTGIQRQVCRKMAYDWGVTFPDYAPDATPKRLRFQKVSNGWDLIDDKKVIGECRRQENGKYAARLFSVTSFENWDARRAMTTLAAEIDALSPDTAGFNGRPVKVIECDADGKNVGTLFPPDDDKLQSRRASLLPSSARAAA